MMFKFFQRIVLSFLVLLPLLSLSVFSVTVSSLDNTLDEEVSFFEMETFSDVSIKHPNWLAIHVLKQMEVFEGYPDGTFGPDNALNRAELLVILMRPLNSDPNFSEEITDLGIDKGGLKYCFPDVADQWFAHDVCLAKELGWVEGYPDGYFRPENSVLKAEAMKMMLEFYSVPVYDSWSQIYDDVPMGQWFSDYVFTAKQLGFLEENGANYYPGEFISRAQIAENFYRMLEWGANNF